MVRMQPLRRHVLPFACVLLLLAGEVCAQGPEAVCIGLRLGIPGARGIRGYGMGNTMVASTGEPHNPAMVFAEEMQATARVGLTEYDDAGETDVISTWLAVQGPLSQDEAFRVVIVDIESDWDPSGWIAAPGAQMRLTGTHLALDYSRAISDRLRVGLAVTPVLDTDISLRMDSVPVVATVSGKVMLRGGRIGVDWQVRDDLRVAAHYDVCEIDAVAVNVATDSRTQADLSLRDFIVGAEWAVDDATSVALEFDAGSVKGGGYRNTVDAISGGVEYRLPEGLALRAGMTDGTPTLGAGWESDEVSVGLAWIRDQYGDEIGAALSTSDAWYLAVDVPFR